MDPSARRYFEKITPFFKEFLEKNYITTITTTIESLIQNLSPYFLRFLLWSTSQTLNALLTENPDTKDELLRAVYDLEKELYVLLNHSEYPEKLPTLSSDYTSIFPENTHKEYDVFFSKRKKIIERIRWKEIEIIRWSDYDAFQLYWVNAWNKRIRKSKKDGSIHTVDPRKAYREYSCSDLTELRVELNNTLRMFIQETPYFENIISFHRSLVQLNTLVEASQDILLSLPTNIPEILHTELIIIKARITRIDELHSHVIEQKTKLLKIEEKNSASAGAKNLKPRTSYKNSMSETSQFASDKVAEEISTLYKKMSTIKKYVNTIISDTSINVQQSA